ncbi:RNA-binding protein rnc1 [Smittium culicis]|uniref:RNA-binding protein rnc1 n=1 Tax=Smittium culicis TaxID=133412 RepID=A0A1R1YSL0_9FUNG|nr:RNA-binding protein rnc1 [Smittium culicis]
MNFDSHIDNFGASGESIAAIDGGKVSDNSMNEFNFGAFQKKSMFSVGNNDISSDIPFMNKNIGANVQGNLKSEKHYETRDDILTIRSLVSTREAGIIIGKGGKNVSELREVSKAKAGVSKVLPGVYERVMSISGTLEQVSSAFEFIAESLAGHHHHHNELNQVDGSYPANDEETENGQIEPVYPHHEFNHGLVVIRILISHTLMGTVIGKQGLKIKGIQELSNTKLIATKEMLPRSTERVIEIHGDSKGVKIAVAEIGKSLLEDSARGIGAVFYSPSLRKSSVSFNTMNAPSYPPGSAGGLGTFGGNSFYSHNESNGSGAKAAPYIPPGFSRQRSNTFSAGLLNKPNDFIASTLSKNAGNTSFPTPTADQNTSIYAGSGAISSDFRNNDRLKDVFNKAEMRIRSYSLSHNHVFSYVPGPGIKTQELIVPGDMVGCIIGKAGSRITEIRRLSKSRIAIEKAKEGDENADRLFTITGSPENNERALLLLYGQLEAEKSRRLANEQLASELEKLCSSDTTHGEETKVNLTQTQTQTNDTRAVDNETGANSTGSCSIENAETEIEEATVSKKQD